MNNFAHFIIIILLIVMAEACAFYCLKEYNITSRNFYFILAITLYVIVCYLLIETFNEKGMALTNVIWSGLSILASTSLGVIYFKEHLEPTDYFGIFFITVGITILKLYHRD